MPSVGMRRSTRVFGARVLRSGRRLWSGPSDLLGNYGDNEFKVKENGWRRDAGVKEKVTVMDIDEKKTEPKKERILKSSDDKMLGSVYQRRKRKRSDSKNSHFDGNLEKKRALDDRKYGKQFVRKQWRSNRLGKNNSCPVAESLERRVFSAAVESSCRGPSLFASVLSMVLRYMRRTKLRLLELHAFVSSEPLANVFSSQGIHFSLDFPSTKSSGICKIYGARCSTPLFAVDFSAVPFCFMYLHSTLLLRSVCFPFGLVTYSSVEDDEMIEYEEHLSCISSERDSSGIQIVTTSNNNSGKSKALRPSVETSKLVRRPVQSRTGVNSRRILKRRGSRKSRRVKKPSVLRGRKVNGALVSNLVSQRCDSIPLVPVASDRQLRSSVRKNSSPNIKLLKSSLVGLTQDICSTRCCANILVIESDKCYRIEGAIIKMESSSSKQWFLAVKKDGMTMYSLTAQKVMRPCSCNRVTHDIIWTEDINSWKLEFPDRRDWLIFKELYKVCSDRNVKAPTSNVIPVPGIHEVFGYADSVNSSFSRPNSYISVKNDELSRALAKGRVANYDMDSEDEEWLREFNNVSFIENEYREHVSEENFELIIDAFERAFYCSPDDCADEKVAVRLCLDLANKEVVEAVYSYWMKKRKKKDSALLRVFQFYKPRRALLFPKPIIRKKRSFNRQPSHSERGKQRTFMQAISPKQDASEEQKALQKVEETKATTSRSEAIAVAKRQKAQVLMENADLAAYKAAMALRIAEAARAAESSDAATSFFLH